MTRALMTAAALVIVLAGLRAAESIVVPLLLSAFLAMLSAPAVLWLQERRVPEHLAVVVVMLVVVAVLVGVFGFVGRSVNGFLFALPRYQARLDDLFGGAYTTVSGYGFVITREEVRQLINPGKAIGFAGVVLSQLIAVLSDTFLIILTMVFMLLEVAVLPWKLRRAIGDDDADLSRFVKVTREVKGYVVIKTAVSAATAILLGVFLVIVGVDFPVLWAVVAFFLNFIPNIGSIIAAVPPVLLAAVQLGPGRAAVVALGYVTVNMVLGNIVEPRLMGRRLGLSTLVVFMSLIFWGWMWGPLGMLLAVPLTMILKIFMENSEELRHVAALLDSGPPRPAPDSEPLG